ncbi:MAG: hypothetical protein U5Q16_04755 [Gammaproteobacteria bacterium]|nr:hypothetical protein [Gammaproteobacteria bacterium]
MSTDTNRVQRQRQRRLSVLLAVAALLCASLAFAQDPMEAMLDSAGVPKIAAFLPDQYSVAKTEALPIDGVWRVDTINKKIRIEQGRAYALDPWRHMFVLQVSPGMVVLQNFRRTGTGTYSADDLPLLGPAAMTLAQDGNLDVVVQGKLGPARYRLIRLDAQYPEALSEELAAVGGRGTLPGVTPMPSPQPYPTPVSPPPVHTPPPAPAPGMPATPPAGGRPAPQPTAPVQPPADCTPIGIDPDTGLTICA